MLRVPAWIAACYAILRTNADPDLWGHTRFGLDLLQAHSLSSVDPYSFTSDLAWTNHEWLAELLMGAAYASDGAFGLIVLKVILILATFVALGIVLRRAPDTWRWPTTFLALWPVVSVAVTVRPQLWTLLFLVLLCHILSGPTRRRLWLPVMFMLWVNLHGGWIVGLSVLGLWSLTEMCGPVRDRSSTSWVIGIPVACALATLGNPYGWHLWEFLARTVRLSRADIVEWQPVWRESVGSVALWLLGIVWVVTAARAAPRRPVKVLAVIALLAFASLWVNRLLPLFIPAAVILLLPYVREVPVADRKEWPRGRTAVDLLVAFVGVLALMWPTSPGCIQMLGSWLPDTAAASALSAARPSGRLVTWFDWGEYAIWHFGPALRVSVDGRRETVYSDATLRRQMAIAFGKADTLPDVERSAPEYVWLPLTRSKRMRDWLPRHGYRIDVETLESFVAVRDDLPRVTAAAVASTGCFPGGSR